MANTKITNPELFNLGDSTSATQLPVMTTTERIAMTGLSVGEMIFNSTTDKVEYFDGTKWYGITYEVAAESPYNNVLYTGNGGTNDISSVGFQPDLVWVKNRSTGDPAIFSSLMSNNKTLFTNSTSAQATLTGGSLSMDTNGFDINTYGATFLNANLQSYVAWCFKAGGAAVSNTDGDVQSNVSANVAGGFSIVKGTGSGSGVQSAGHGLSSAPEFILVKNINATDNWFCLVPGLTSSNYYMRLNTTDAEINNGTPTIFADSTTVSVRQNSMGSWGNLIAYCFHSVPGYSKVGSYTGNGSTSTGKTIDLGFQPAFIMIKNITTTGSSSGWFMIDNKRNTSDPWNKYIFANNNAAEGTTTLSLTSVGATSFTVKSSGRAINYNGDNYTYMAFA